MHECFIVYIYISGGDAATFRHALRCNWSRIIDSIDDATAFANQLKQAGLIPHPVFNTAIHGRLGQTIKDRVTNLLSSAEEAVKNRDKQHFVKLCEIVREVGDSAVADKLLHEANIASGRSKYNHTILGSTHTLPHHCSWHVLYRESVGRYIMSCSTRDIQYVCTHMYYIAECYSNTLYVTPELFRSWRT